MHTSGFFAQYINGDKMFTTIIRIVILYLLVTVAMRLMGKRQIGEMQPAELVVTLLISEIAAIPIQDSSQPVLSAVLAISALAALEIIITVITLKSSFLNNLTNGKSAVVINRGVINQRLLKKLRVTVADLVELLRQQGIFDIRDVYCAVLETDGGLSVLQKPNKQGATVDDVKGNFHDFGGYPSLVVSDGEIVKRGLDDVGITKEDIEIKLKKSGTSLCDVFIMTVDEKGNAVVIKKEV